MTFYEAQVASIERAKKNGRKSAYILQCKREWIVCSSRPFIGGFGPRKNIAPKLIEVYTDGTQTILG